MVKQIQTMVKQIQTTVMQIQTTAMHIQTMVKQLTSDSSSFFLLQLLNLLVMERWISATEMVLVWSFVASLTAPVVKEHKLRTRQTSTEREQTCKRDQFYSSLPDYRHLFRILFVPSRTADYPARQLLKQNKILF